MDCLDVTRDCSETLTDIGFRTFKFIECVSVCLYVTCFLQTLFVCMENFIFIYYSFYIAYCNTISN